MRPAASRTARIIAIVVGIVVALVGLVALAGGVILLGVFGSDGTAASGTHRFASENAALVTKIDDVDDVGQASDVVGEPRLDMTFKARSAHGVFIGVGPAAAVDRYLASSPIDEVTDFDVDPFKLERRERRGSKRPAPPAKQSFWEARGSGRQAAKLRWKLRDGDHRVVVMNADGSRPVATVGELKLTVPHVARSAWILIGVGLVLALGGVAVAGIGGRTKKPKPARSR
jgi:hypothetical protein